MTIKRYFLFSLFLALVSLFSWGNPVLAGDPKPTIRDEAYAAKFVSQSIPDPIKIEAGKTQTVTIRFKNTGTATWEAKGKNFISAYTVEPNYRNSIFQGSNWLSKSQTAKIAGTVKPGGIGELSLTLSAPTTPGDYVERFYLAAENHSWVSGSYFYVKIQVTKTAASDSVTPEPEKLDGPLSAAIILQSKKTVKVEGGEKVSLVVAYKNTGKTPWKGYSVRANSPTALAGGTLLTFADSAWKSNTLVSEVKEDSPAGGIVRKTISFRAPRKQGTYTAVFSLEVEGKPVPGTEAEVQVTVTEDAPAHYQEPVFTNNTSPQAPRLSTEPRIRVGIWKMDETYVLFKSDEDDYKIFDGIKEVSVLPRGKTATIQYKNGEYSLKSGEISVKSTNYIRLAPALDTHAVFTLVNYDHKVSWKGKSNFNKYRGAMELRRVQEGSDLYVVNELLLEDYMKGMSENSNSAPGEYLKAQSVAQRTYAYYIKEFSDKNDKRNFDVFSTTADQLYLGYESEMLMPNFVAAAVATRGYMATYDIDNNSVTPNQVIITPYFANTDGRTRAWTEVWGGSAKPWLVSVKAGYDKGKKLFGHGVGMSQLDAANRADKEGTKWEDLVKYYYTGVAVEKMYE